MLLIVGCKSLICPYKHSMRVLPLNISVTYLLLLCLCFPRRYSKDFQDITTLQGHADEDTGFNWSQFNVQGDADVR